MKSDLFAIRLFNKRPATPTEIRSTAPYFKLGRSPLKKIGILFIHGFSGTPAAFKNYAEFFSQQGFTVSVPLLPGHGKTLEAFEKFGRRHWVRGVVNSFEELEKHCEKIFVVGNSLGGTLAIHLAAQKKQIRKIYLLSPFIYIRRDHHFINTYLFPIIKRLGINSWMAIAGDVKNPRGFELAFSKIPLSLGTHIEKIALEAQSLLPKIQQDVLIFQGTADRGVPAKRAPEIIKNLGSKKKELVWLHNSWHLIPIDFQANEVRDHIFNDMLAKLRISKIKSFQPMQKLVAQAEGISI